MSLKLFSSITLVLFGAFSVWVVSEIGYLGIVEYHLPHPAGWQVFIDLVIACILLLAIIVPDAKAKGRNPWPFVVLTVLLGSIGPLAYFATQKKA